MIKSAGPNPDPWGMLLTTALHLHIDHWSELFDCVHSASSLSTKGSTIKHWSLQLRDKAVVWDSVRCYFPVQVDGISRSSLICHYYYFTREGLQICQAHFAFSEIKSVEYFLCCWLPITSLFTTCLHRVSRSDRHWGETDPARSFVCLPYFPFQKFGLFFFFQ